MVSEQWMASQGKIGRNHRMGVRITLVCRLISLSIFSIVMIELSLIGPDFNCFVVHISSC